MRAFVLFALAPRLDRPIAPAVLSGRRVASGFPPKGSSMSADVSRRYTADRPAVDAGQLRQALIDVGVLRPHERPELPPGLTAVPLPADRVVLRLDDWGRRYAEYHQRHAEWPEWETKRMIVTNAPPPRRGPRPRTRAE